MTAASIRMPDSVYARLKTLAQAEGRSLNEVTVEILDRETRRQLTLRALDDAKRLRAEIRADHGELPDSAPLLHQLRQQRSDRG